MTSLHSAGWFSAIPANTMLSLVEILHLTYPPFFRIYMYIHIYIYVYIFLLYIDARMARRTDRRTSGRLGRADGRRGLACGRANRQTGGQLRPAGEALGEGPTELDVEGSW